MAHVCCSYSAKINDNLCIIWGCLGFTHYNESFIDISPLEAPPGQRGYDNTCIDVRIMYLNGLFVPCTF